MSVYVLGVCGCCREKIVIEEDKHPESLSDLLITMHRKLSDCRGPVFPWPVSVNKKSQIEAMFALLKGVSY